MRRSVCVLPEQLNQFIAFNPLNPLTVAFEGVSCQDEFIHCSHSFLRNKKEPSVSPDFLCILYRAIAFTVPEYHENCGAS